jgi:hypothetical protein
MRPPTNAFEGEVYDAYWAMNRAHKGLHDALTLLSNRDAKWKDCQKAALLAEDKVNDAVEIWKVPQKSAEHDALPSHMRVWIMSFHERGVWGRLRLHAKKAAAAPNPEKMKKALMEALRITKEMEEDILQFYGTHSAPHVTQLENLKASRKKRSYGVSWKRNKRSMKRNMKRSSIRKRKST